MMFTKFNHLIKDCALLSPSELHLVLLRGLPGSGKSWFAKNHYPTYEHWETDMLFEKDGVYTFDPSMLKAYHTVSHLYVRQLLKARRNVVVANTFSMLWEMAAYEKMAKEANAKVSVFKLDYPINKCMERQVHGVPYKTLMAMLERWEPVNGEVVIYND